jgi:ATP-dependent Clp protease protease subunit
MTGPQIPNSQLPSELFVTCVGPIDQGMLHRIFNGFAMAMGNKVQHVHMLFQSSGGTVSDGVCLYNYLRALPVKVSLYNVGMVASIAALAYLGAKTRKTSATATFMLHRTQATPIGATAERLHALGKSVALDDQRTETILREHLKMMPDELWEVHKIADLWLSADEAIRFGLATDIGDFAPPLGSQVFNI